MITFSDFEKVDMRVGIVVDAQAFPEARRPAFKLWIDFGSLGVKRSSAPDSRAGPLRSSEFAGFSTCGSTG